MRESSDPRTAIQAAAGAIPSAKPKTRCDHLVHRLVYEYNSRTANATGDSKNASRFNCHAANTKIPQDITTKFLTKLWVNAPAGNARVRVRGFAASMEASAKRLNDIAADRAATMATMIQTIWCTVGSPSAASIAPHNANGSAKTECSHLIISRVTRRFFRRGTEHSKRSVTFRSNQRDEAAAFDHFNGGFAFALMH